MDDKTKEVMERLEKGILDTMDSEKYKAFLNVQTHFHAYSFNNAMLIYLQKPSATRVAGFRSWQKLERHVLKGEKGIDIFAPTTYKYNKLVDKLDAKTSLPVRSSVTGDIEKVNAEVRGLSFIKVSVFDVSQTDGKELPTLCDELQGNTPSAANVISAIKKISTVPVIEEAIEGGAKGYYSRGENIIALKKGMALDQTAKTLIHEYAHSQLHNTETAQNMNRATKEVQAESVAYIVSQQYGVDTSEYSFEYLAHWSKGKELAELKASFSLIQKTANKIILEINESLTPSNQLINEPVNKVQDVVAPVVVKDQVVSQYSKEFPAIKHIKNETAAVIGNLNKDRETPLTIKEIKSSYQNVGKKLEGSHDKTDLQEFKLLQNVVEDLNKAQLTVKQLAAHQKALEKGIVKGISIEMN